MKKKGLKILLIDNRKLIRDGLKYSLMRYNNLKIVGETEDLSHGVKLAGKTQPDIILIGGNSISLIEQNPILISEIKNKTPKSKILVIVNPKSQKLIENLINGVNGYVSEEWSLEQLIKGLHHFQKEGILFPRSLIPSLVRSLKELRPQKFKFSLTEKELRILKLLAKGKTNKEIAHDTFICEKTVKNHLYSIYRKLGVQRRTEALAIALSLGII